MTPVINQRIVIACALCAAAVASCAKPTSSTQAPPESPREPARTTEPIAPPVVEAPQRGGLTELAPGLRIDASAGIVEFDGRVSPMITGAVHGRDRFLLEQFVCLAGTKDHESVVVTDVKPSAIHAALLAAGATAGSPVTWVTEADAIRVVPPSGTPVTVELVVGDGGPQDARVWVVDADSGEPLTGGGWVFAGSTVKPSRDGVFYEADAAGTLIGLAGFGSETIAWIDPISDQEEEGDLRWVAADAARAHAGKSVRVRITVVR